VNKMKKLMIFLNL